MRIYTLNTVLSEEEQDEKVEAYMTGSSEDLSGVNDFKRNKAILTRPLWPEINEPEEGDLWEDQ